MRERGKGVGVGVGVGVGGAGLRDEGKRGITCKGLR